MNFNKMKIKKEIGRNISLIFRATSSRMQECHNKHEFSVSMAQLPTLSFLIDNNDKNCISQDFITKSLGVDKASTTRTVKKLIKQGYVIRTRDKKDKRAYNLSLTEEGKNLKLQVMKIMIEWTNIVYDGITQEEIDRLHKITNKMANNIKKYKEEKKYENN